MTGPTPLTAAGLKPIFTSFCEDAPAPSVNFRLRLFAGNTPSLHTPRMDNLALNKPALQSSVSAWSSSKVPSEAARGGNDGDLSRDLGIHTDAGRDPWWQVDLQGIYALDRVCLFNRDAFPERLIRFSVLGSLDDVVWDLVASKSDDTVFGPDGEPYVLDLPRRPVLRYLRIRLDGLNCLHFKECRVFGMAAELDASAPVPADPRRVVFSALYNESDAFLAAYLANFLHYTGPESVLLVNLPPNRSIPALDANDRIIVFNGTTKRHKSGHTLLLGHLESYELALHRFGQFDYFCPLASNSLFVRRFDPVAAIRQLRAGHKVPTDLDVTYDIGLDIDRLPRNWHWPKIADNALLIAFLKDRWSIQRLSENQIEGLLASSADWGLLHARMSDFPSMGSLLVEGESAFLPLEEILPSTFFLSFGTGCYVNICRVFWNRFNHTGSGRVTTEELLGFGRYPAHLCLVKWFERDARAVETAVVTQPWSQALLASLTSPSPAGIGDRLMQRLLLESVTASMRMREVTTPLAAGWRALSDRALEPCAFYDPMMLAERQTVHLQTVRTEADTRSDAFLYLEHTQHRIDLSVRIEHGLGTQILIRCNRLEAASDAGQAPTLEGFLYLRTSWIGAAPIVRMRMLASRLQRELVTRTIVLMVDNEYTRIAPLHSGPHGEAIDYYFSENGLAKDSLFWLGIPIFSDVHFQAELMLIYDAEAPA